MAQKTWQEAAIAAGVVAMQEFYLHENHTDLKMEVPSVQKKIEDVEDDKSKNNSNNTEGKGLSGLDYKARKFKTIFFLLRAHSLTKFQTAIAVMLIMCDARNI